MGPKNAHPFVFFRGLLLSAVFITAIESSTVYRSAYFSTLADKQLKGFVVKRFKSPGQISCSQSCLKNTWCTSTNFKLAPQTSDGEGTCELNKHNSSVIKQNTYLQFENGVAFSMLWLKGCPTTNNCENGGACVYDEKKQSYSCQCKPPWTGETCTDLEVTCDSHPCKNNGTCTDRVNEYNCSCAPGFYGIRCEKIEGLSCSTAYRIIFQEQLSTKSYAKKENATSSKLSEFTVCFFVKSKDINSTSSQCLFSYAEASHIKGNGISIFLNNPRIDVMVDVSGSHGTDTGVKINDTMWHHICVTWKSTKGTWQLYLDGQLRNSGTGLKEGYQVPSGGTVVIGQDQDTVGGGFNIEDSFGPGEVTEVNLWSRVLSASDIAEQYANCNITEVDLMHGWKQFKDGLTNLTIIEP